MKKIDLKATGLKIETLKTNIEETRENPEINTPELEAELREEVIDTLADVGGTIAAIEAKADDRLRLTEMLELAIRQQDEVTDVIDDFPEFIKGVQKTELEDAPGIIAEAKRRVEAEHGPLRRFGNMFFDLIGNSLDDYAFAKFIYDQSGTRLKRWRETFSG